MVIHPEGLAARTVNLGDWCGHLLERLHRQCEATADPELMKLYQELKAYPIPARQRPISSDSVAIPFKLRLGGEVLSFISTTMIFGTPVDITLVGIGAGDVLPGRRPDSREDAGDIGRSRLAHLSGSGSRLISGWLSRRMPE